MSEGTPAAATRDVAHAAGDLAALIRERGWEPVLDPSGARESIASGVQPAHAGPAEIDAVAALTTLDAAPHVLATATDPVATANHLVARLVRERAVPLVAAHWAVAVVLEVVQPGWGIHFAALAPPPDLAASASVPAPRGASRYVFAAVVAAIVVVGVAVALVFFLTSGGTSETATTAPPGPRTAPESPVGDLTVEGVASPNEPAPALSGPDILTNQQFSLAGMSGKPTLLVFWAHWCPHCQKEMPVIQQVADEEAASFNFLTVTTAIGAQPAKGDFSSPERLMVTQGITMPALRDGTDAAARAYAIAGFPTMFMVDASGKLVGRVSGELSAEDLMAFMQHPGFSK